MLIANEGIVIIFGSSCTFLVQKGAYEGSRQDKHLCLKSDEHAGSPSSTRTGQRMLGETSKSKPVRGSRAGRLEQHLFKGLLRQNLHIRAGHSIRGFIIKSLRTTWTSADDRHDGHMHVKTYQMCFCGQCILLDLAFHLLL